MAKPKVDTNPVANQYTGANERIIEYSHNGVGGLISFREPMDGSPRIVEVYQHDAAVEVRVGTPRGT